MAANVRRCAASRRSMEASRRRYVATYLFLGLSFSNVEAAPGCMPPKKKVCACLFSIFHIPLLQIPSAIRGSPLTPPQVCRWVRTEVRTSRCILQPSFVELVETIGARQNVQTMDQHLCTCSRYRNGSHETNVHRIPVDRSLRATGCIDTYTTYPPYE